MLCLQPSAGHTFDSIVPLREREGLGIFLKDRMPKTSAIIIRLGNFSCRQMETGNYIKVGRLHVCPTITNRCSLKSERDQNYLINTDWNTLDLQQGARRRQRVVHVLDRSHKAIKRKMKKNSLQDRGRPASQPASVSLKKRKKG